MQLPPSRNRNMYDAISTLENDQLEETVGSCHEEFRADSISGTSTNITNRKKNEDKPLEEVKYNEEESEYAEGTSNRVSTGYVQIVILDSAQNRFLVDVDPGWTVLKLKQMSQEIHRVAPHSQRLIFRGRLLEDVSTLKELGINENGVIIHLFPKPRLVMTSSIANESDTREKTISIVGAHIPQIVIDEEEQERRGQILVLGSVEIAEAQNNIKLLSLLLLVICSMRLLVLLSTALGTPTQGSHDEAGQGNSTTLHPDEDQNSGDYDAQSRPWESYDYYDLILSALGFYVATLGMKATTENTLRLATAYFVGTTAVGIFWNVWNIFVYAMFMKEKSSQVDDDEEPLTRDDYVTVALFTVMLPMLIWGLCVARAYEFRRLIEEADSEANGRIHGQTQIDEEAELNENADNGSIVV